MRPLTAVLALLLLGLGATAWVLFSQTPDPLPRTRSDAAVLPQGGAAVAAPLPALGGGGRGDGEPGSAGVRDAIENAPARAALRAAMAQEAERRITIDVAGLRGTAPGQAAMRCLAQQGAEDLQRLRDRAGFDPFDQIDEMAVVDGVAVARGRFADVKWEKINEDREVEITPYGKRGQLYLTGDRGVATWGDQLLIGDGNRDQLIAALDRIEGRAEQDEVPELNGTAGLLPAEDLFEVLPVAYEVREPIRDYLREHHLGLGFALAASDAGVQVTVRISGDEEAVTTLTAALESARQGALQADFQERLAELVKGIQIKRVEDGLEIVAEVPMAMLEEVMGPCAHEDGDARE